MNEVDFSSLDRQYAYSVIWSTEDNAHIGLCSEFPSLSWVAQTPEAALKGIKRVVRNVILDMAGEKSS